MNSNGSSGGAAGGAGAAAGHGGNRAGLWFCHSCNRSIREVTEEFQCGRCGSGFIEEFDAGRQYDEAHDVEGIPADFHGLLSSVFGGSLGPAGHGAGAVGGRGRGAAGGPGRATVNISFGGGHGTPVVVGGGGGSGGAGLMGPPEVVFREIFNNLTGLHMQGPVQGAPGFQLYGNPGDYAWGRGGFDAVVTQLLNQMEGTGPPPLQDELINKIPSIQINQSHIDASSQCSVCWEDFKLGENVRQLICDHLYHDPCIVPWLRIHGTCPVCRKPQDSTEEGSGQSASEQGAADGNPSNTSGSSLGETITSVFNNLFGGSPSSSNPDAFQTPSPSWHSQPPDSGQGSSPEENQNSTGAHALLQRGGREDTTGSQDQGERRTRNNFEDFDLE